MTATPTLTELLDLAISSHVRDIHVAEPGKVISYDSGAGLADVQPLISTIVYNDEGEKELEPKPILRAVPVINFRAGGYAIEFPVQKGDFVLLIYCTDNIGQWFVEEDKSDPGDYTKHSLSGAVAIPGLFPQGQPSNQSDGEHLVIAGDGGVYIGDKDASEPLVLGEALKSWLESVTFPTSFGPTGTAIQAGTLPTILSGRHKVDS